MSVPPAAGGSPAPVPRTVRLATLVLGLEAAGLATLAAVDADKILTGAPRSVGYAAAAAVMTLLCGLLLLVLARALGRLARWAFTPTLVVQILALPVGYSLAVQAGVWRYGGPVLLLALSEIAALLAPASRRALITPR